MKKYEWFFRTADFLLIPLILYLWSGERSMWIFSYGLIPSAVLGIVGIVIYYRLPENEKVKPVHYIFNRNIRNIHPYIHGGWFVVLWFLVTVFALWKDRGTVLLP